MDDTISRRAAIDALERSKDKKAKGDIGGFYNTIIQNDIDKIKVLPSAQPESQWILCNKKMPEEHEWIGTKKFGTTISDEVYVTFEAPDGQRFAKHISFQNGKLSSVDEQRMKAWYKGAKPIAWMPLPEPYKGGVE